MMPERGRRRRVFLDRYYIGLTVYVAILILEAKRPPVEPPRDAKRDRPPVRHDVLTFEIDRARSGVELPTADQRALSAGIRNTSNRSIRLDHEVEQDF